VPAKSRARLEQKSRSVRCRTSGGVSRGVMPGPRRATTVGASSTVATSPVLDDVAVPARHATYCGVVIIRPRVPASDAVSTRSTRRQAISCSLRDSPSRRNGTTRLENEQEVRNAVKRHMPLLRTGRRGRAQRLPGLCVPYPNRSSGRLSNVHASGSGEDF
jgi:hypothetical protein